ncbi:MAG: Asp/Glu racemase, partial [Paracoccaceae bacterium]
MTAFAYTLAPDPVQMGVVVLQTDETLEADLRRLLPDAINWLVSRVPAATDVSADSLQAIEHHLTGAASLFPTGAQMAAVGYGCTSGTAQVGADVISARVRAGVTTLAVTEPVSALIAACHTLGIQRLALLSPYVATVSDRLRDVLAEAGIATPVFGSFHEANEAQVV